jgi:hypothetical protein
MVCNIFWKLYKNILPISFFFETQDRLSKLSFRHGTVEHSESARNEYSISGLSMFGSDSRLARQATYPRALLVSFHFAHNRILPCIFSVSCLISYNGIERQSAILLHLLSLNTISTSLQNSSPLSWVCLAPEAPQPWTAAIFAKKRLHRRLRAPIGAAMPIKRPCGYQGFTPKRLERPPKQTPLQPILPAEPALLVSDRP